MQGILKKRRQSSRALRQRKSTTHGQEQTELKPNLKRYSFIYNDLVEGPQDFIGLVAYSIYKQEKICHVKKFEAEQGRSPSPEELISFHDIARGHLESYKEQAENRVSAFYEEIYKEHSELIDQRFQELLYEIKGSKTGWGKGIGQSIIGSALGSIIIGIIVICILYSQYGLGWIIQEILKSAVK